MIAIFKNKANIKVTYLQRTGKIIFNAVIFFSPAQSCKKNDSNCLFNMTSDTTKVFPLNFLALRSYFLSVFFLA